MVEMIDSEEKLIHFCDQWAQSDYVALDTEFVWTRTFWPRLGLIQVGWGDGLAELIDVPALEDLSPLGAIVGNPSIELILHDAPQDLTILRRACGAAPRRVFDTRQAAGFAGLGATLSLNALLGELLQIELPKTETRTNWLARPLTDNQVEYALDDVRYLAGLREHLVRLISEFGNEALFAEERTLVEEDPCTLDRLPEDMWARIKSARRMNDRERLVLRELASWRESEAHRRDLPRNTVVPEKLLVALARRQPQSESDMSVWRDEYKGSVDRYGKQLIEAIERGLQSEDSLKALEPDRKSSTLEAQVTAWTKIRDTRSQERGIDPGLVATKADLTSLAREGSEVDQNTHRLLQGWRKSFLGQELLESVGGTGS